MSMGAKETDETNAMNISGVLAAVVDASGRTRREIGARSAIHKDALRRILAGERSPTFSEAAAILDASRCPSHTALVLCILGENDRAIAWNEEPIARFLDTFLAELPGALERTLGNQLHEIRPRWAKGTALRVARLLSDHIEELEKKDALFGENLERTYG